MRNPVRGWLSNWPWKLVALLVACFIFYSIRRSVSYTQSLTLTVEAAPIENSDVALMGFSPDYVTVTFQGSEAAIRRLSFAGFDPPRVRVQLPPPASGVTSAEVTLRHSDVLCDDRLRVVSIEPKTITATFDAQQTRAFPVDDPVVTGTPKDSTVTITIEPKTIELTGSSSLLDSMEAQSLTLQTSTLDLSKQTKSFQTTLRVLPPDNSGGWKLSPETVRADVRFLKDDTQRALKDVPVHILQAPSGTRYRAETPSVEVTLMGDRHDLSAINDQFVEVLLSEPANPNADEKGRILCEPTVLLPCTNRVDRVEVKPPRIWLAPITTQPEAATLETTPIGTLRSTPAPERANVPATPSTPVSDSK